MTDLQNRMITALVDCNNIFDKVLDDPAREIPTGLQNNITVAQIEIQAILDTNLSSPELNVHQDGSIDKLNKTLQQTNIQLDYLNKSLQRR